MTFRKIGLLVGMGTLAIASLAFAKSQLEIKSRDQCDPSTFNAGRPNPLCSGPKTGSVTLQKFLDAIPGGGHNAWKFDPGTSGGSIDNGGSVRFTSDGGEAHTFTRVASFGGGIVQPFNAAVGNAPVAPECQAMAGSNGVQNTTQGIVVAPGSEQSVTAGGTLLPKGTHTFQCCFHPWMRTTITVK